MIRPVFFANNTVTGVVYADMLEEFLKTVLKDVFSLCATQGDRAPPLSHIVEFLDRNFSLKLAKANLPLGHLDPLTLYHLTFCQLGVNKLFFFFFTFAHPFAGTC